MKAAVYHGKEDVRVDSVPDAAIQQDGDALIRVERTAICGSDLHMWHSESPASGFTLGHEVLGVVEDVGSAVGRFRRGDRVVVSCTTACGHCDLCALDRYGNCRETTRLGGPYSNIFGSPLLAGGQAEALRVPCADASLFPIPEGVSDEQVLFLSDILPTGYLGAELASIEPGDVVVVYGCGPVGHFAQRTAALFGPSAIVAVDLDEGRLARAKQRGCIPVNPAHDDVAEVVRSLTNGRGADAAIEAVGRADLVSAAMEVVRPGGRVSIVGVITQDRVEVPILSGLMGKQITLRAGIVEPQRVIGQLLPLIQQGKLDPSEIITHRLPLDRAPDGYRVFANHEEDVMKVVLEP